MSIEDQIQSTESLQRDPNMNFLVHGPPGSGKTYATRTLPGNTLVISAESGLQSIADVSDIDLIRVASMSKAREAYKYLHGDEHDYDSVALDSITEIAEICLSQQKEDKKHGQAAYGEMQDRIIKLLRSFRALDMTVYFSAKQQRMNTDDGLLYMPNMPGKTLTTKRPIGHDFDFVFPIITRENDGEISRAFKTQQDGKHQAKARDPNHALDKFEPVNIEAIRNKIISSYSEGGDQ